MRENRPHRNEIPGPSSPGPRVKFNLNNDWRECSVAALISKSISVLGLCILLLFPAPQLDMSLHLVAVLSCLSSNFIFPTILYTSFAFLQAVWAPFYSFTFPSDFCNSFVFLKAVWAPFYSFTFPSDFCNSFVFLQAVWAPFYSFTFPSDFCNSIAFLQAAWAPIYSFIFPSDFCNSIAFLQAAWAPIYSFIFPSDFCNSIAFLQAVWAPFYIFIFPSDFCNSIAFLQAVWAPFYSFIFPSDFSDSWLQFLAAITLSEIFTWLKKTFRLCFSIYVKWGTLSTTAKRLSCTSHEKQTGTTQINAQSA